MTVNRLLQDHNIRRFWQTKKEQMMTAIYIGYYNLVLRLFKTEESETPCGDQFDVAYGTTEMFQFRVKQAVTDVKFDAENPIKWFNSQNESVPRPTNITAPVLTHADRVLNFQDTNSTTSEIHHRFALEMLADGQPVTIGPGPELASEKSLSATNSGIDLVDPTIIDKGDHGSGPPKV